MKTIHMLRHGLTRGNEEFLFYGATDLPLTETGRAALQTLRETRRYPAAAGTHVCTSGLRRTEETLSLLYGDIPHEAVPALREINFGLYEMRSYNDLKDDPAFQHWMANSLREAPRGGESGLELQRRAAAGLAGLLEQYDELLLVIHGGVISALMATLFPGEREQPLLWQPQGGEGYSVTVEQGRGVSWRAIPE